MEEENGIIRVKIGDANSRGQGVARIGGKAAFVPFTAPGDLLDVRIVGDRKNYIECETVKIVEPSPCRVSPDCPLFGKCGGCTLRHVSYETEGEIKRRVIEGALLKQGIRDVPVAETLLPRPDGYRNKATFRFDPDGRPGYYEKSTNRTVPLGERTCKILPERISEAAACLGRLGGAGMSRGVTEFTLRESTGGGVLLLLRHENGLSSGDLKRIAGTVTKECPFVTGVIGKGSGASDGIEVLSGEAVLRNELFGLSLTVSPESFFQVNYEGAEMLFDAICEAARETGFSRCADLFCGTGIWGLALAGRYPEKTFCGVDIDSGAIADARANAERNGLGNVSFFAGDASILPDGYEPDLVLLDPPRKGCSDRMIGTLIGIKPENIIYVSCNPFTMARDVKKLSESGYAPRKMTPVNMFPRTEHVETVVLMSKELNT